MYLENIRIDYVDGTDTPDPELKDIHYIDAINREALYTCPICGYPMVPKTPNYRTIVDYRPGPDGVERVYFINLKSERYECCNPQNKHSVTAGMLPHKSPLTEEFKKHVVWMFLHQEKHSYSMLARQLKQSQPVISKIIKNFASKLNLHFSPLKDTFYLYFHPFPYLGKQCYYLVKVAYDGTPCLISFFGFKDALTELEDYLKFHWKPDNTAYFTIFLEPDPALKELIEKYIPHPMIFPSRETVDARLDAFLEKHSEDGVYFPLRDKLKEFRRILTIPQNDDLLQAWYNSFQYEEPNLCKVLNEFRADLEKEPISSTCYRIFLFDYSLLNQMIAQYNAQHLPFDILVLRLMYKVQGDDIFEDQEPSHALFDPDSGIHFRQPPLSKLDKMVKKSEKFAKEIERLTKEQQEQQQQAIEDGKQIKEREKQVTEMLRRMEEGEKQAKELGKQLEEGEKLIKEIMDFLPEMDKFMMLNPLI